MTYSLTDFVRESNRIEGINREPKLTEIVAHQAFLARADITIYDLCAFVTAVQPYAVLRDMPGLNVRVGDHVAPLGGPEIVTALDTLLGMANCGQFSPYLMHCKYETLHPFTDGNGRSGRILWLWMHGGSAPLGFLHHFYYETLSSLRMEPSDA